MTPFVPLPPPPPSLFFNMQINYLNDRFHGACKLPIGSLINICHLIHFSTGDDVMLLK